MVVEGKGSDVEVHSGDCERGAVAVSIKAHLFRSRLI